MQYFNPRTEKLFKFGADGVRCSQPQKLALTVEENIRIYGGDVISDSVRHWNLDEDFMEDIELIWELCEDNPTVWNSVTNLLAAANSQIADGDEPLTVQATDAEIANFLGEKKKPGEQLLEKLSDNGIFTSFTFEADGFAATYKNEQIKQCLAKAGEVLELKVYKAALRAKDEEGNPFYNDVKTGAFLDWDGIVEEGGAGTANEVDVVLMKGTIPIFVSCKNGNVNADELYKLETVAKKFGGKYAKKVLVATQLYRNEKSARMLALRAHDMGIRLIDRITCRDEAEFEEMVMKFWCD